MGEPNAPVADEQAIDTDALERGEVESRQEVERDDLHEVVLDPVGHALKGLI